MASVSKTAKTTEKQARKALASYFTHNDRKRVEQFGASRGLGFETAYRTLRSIAGAEFCKKGDAKRVRRGLNGKQAAPTPATEAVQA
jgi:hypothetical protein